MNISNEELKEIGQILIAASEGKPLEYHMEGSDNPWEDYKETVIDLEYELHLYRQGKRFRVKDPILVRMQKVEEERQKEERKNRKLKQLLLMGVPIQYHQYHNWQPVKSFGHFLILEKDSCTEFRINTTFQKSLQIYYNDNNKSPTLLPKKGDTFVGSYDTYIDWIKEHLEWEPVFMEDKTYYIKPSRGFGNSFKECQDKLFHVKLYQGENVAEL